MESKKILILGGYGSTGFPLARLLLQESDVHLILAGRQLEKAQAAAAQLNARFPGERACALAVDASDRRSLTAAFQGVEMVVVASSTAAYTRQVARAAIEARLDYLDVLYAVEKVEILKSLTEEIEQAGLCFITDGGFHPGLPAAMVRYAAPKFDRLVSANVGSVIKIDWGSLSLSNSTIEEFVGEFKDFNMLHFKKGRWKKAGALGMLFPKFMDFGPPFGRGYCLPMFLEEMRALPEMYPALQETGFFVGGFNWFVDWFLGPAIMLMLWASPEKSIPLAGRLLWWGLETFSRPPYGTLLKLEARGTRENAPHEFEVTLCHQDGYLLTAIPAAACLLQFLDGSIRKPGLWLQAQAVDPERFLKDMQRLGVEIRTREGDERPEKNASHPGRG